MSHDLTINRYAAITGAPVFGTHGLGLQGGDLVLAFRRQTELLNTLPEYAAADAAMLKVAQTWDAAAAEISLPPNPLTDNVPDVIGVLPEADEAAAKKAPAQNSQKFDTLLGIQPFRKISCKLAGLDWVIRTRASMTACDLGDNAGQTKLMYMIEGIPLGAAPVDGEQAASFVKLADAMEAQAMPLFRDAYNASLKTVTERPARFDLGGGRVRVTIAENDTRPTAELLDAIYFHHAGLSQIEDEGLPKWAPAREGLGELAQFVGNVTGHKVGTQTLEVDSSLPLAKGLLCREEDLQTHSVLVAGFARFDGGGSGFILEPEPRIEKYVRTFSAAREISAVRVYREARDLARRLAPAQLNAA